MALTICGYAAMFDTDSPMPGGFAERVVRGAFRHVLDARTRIELRTNHWPGGAYAATSDGSLTLTEDVAGLWFEARLSGGDAAWFGGLLRSGQIAGCSIGWTGDDDAWDRRKTLRTLRRINLQELSVVTGSETLRPAWRGTWALAAGPAAYARRHREMREAMDQRMGRESAGGNDMRERAIVETAAAVRIFEANKPIVARMFAGSGVRCEACSTGRAFTIRRDHGKASTVCASCKRSGRPARATVAAIPSRTTSSPAPHQFNRDSWARYKAAKRDEFITPMPAPVRPQRAEPHPAGDKDNYRVPRHIPTRWFETPDDRP